MAAVIPVQADQPASGNPVTRVLWDRHLPHYPTTGRRYLYLAIVVLVTIMLYYSLYVGGAVAPSIIQQYNMSFTYYVNIIVVGNAIGAFSSLVAGLADKWGRANMTVYGVGITALLVLFGIPNAPNKFVFATLTIIVGFVEGVILVATPALVRDFSPQLGRASAMGFWTLGPVVGSLVVSEVSSHTLTSHPNWQFQFTICGIVGLVVFVVALFGLKELSPNLRDQLMVSMRDRALIEAKAAGIDVKKAIQNPWRQMMHFNIVASAFAIGVFLLLYYTAVGFFTVYFTSLFGFTQAQANGIGNWFWSFDALALIVVGVLSDRARVRKPFMVIGAIGAIVMTIIFLSKAGAPHTSFTSFAVIISILAAFMGIAYAPWMASFTETVEQRNPALIATGLAVYGWVIRAIVALSVFLLPFVVSTVTPLVQYGTEVATLSAKYPETVTVLTVVDPATLNTLSADPTNVAAGQKAVGELVTKLGETPTQATQQLLAAGSTPKADVAYLVTHGAQVEQASRSAPGQWQAWWWICLGGQVLFIPLIFVMSGRWDPRRAKRDLAEHQQRVDAELAELAKS